MATIAQMVGRPEADIKDDLRLSEDLGLSSLDRVELISQLENDYGLEIDEGSFASTTVGEIRSYVQRGLQPSDETPASAPAKMPRWPRAFPTPWVRHVVLGFGAKLLWNRYIDFSVEGLSNLEDIDPPVLFAANHASHLDTIAVLMGLPFPWRRLVAPAMQQEHFRAYFEPKGHPLKERAWRAVQYAMACGLVGAYPLPQQMAGVRCALEFTGELVEKGYCPLVYPEGERTSDGTMHPFKPGIALMAQQLKVPVIPIHLQGMFEVYSIHHSWPETGSVHMRMGAPMYFAEGLGYDEIAQEVEEAVRTMGTPQM
jgi:long-chain acyl-CoA synthetase